MATVRFPYTETSTDVKNSCSTIVGSAQSAHGFFNTTSGASGGNAYIYIYSGTRLAWTSITTLNQMGSGLIRFQCGINPGTGSVSTINGKTYWRFLSQNSPANTTAYASGTASWFICSRNSNNFNTQMTGVSGFTGTVGVTGSGADLEIPSLSIVNGQAYSLSGIYFNWPVEWTV